MKWGLFEWGHQDFGHPNGPIVHDISANFDTLTTLTITNIDIIHIRSINAEFSTATGLTVEIQGITRVLEMELAAYLGKQDIVDFSEYDEANNTYLNYLPSEPNEAIGIYSTGGPWPSPKFIEQEGDVQFITRCGKDDPRTALNTAEDIFDELEGLSDLHLVLDGRYIIGIQAKQPRPVHIGRDENGRHKYSINFRVRYERPSAHRG